MRRAAFSACISSSCCWRRFWRHSSSISLRWSAAMPTATPAAARPVSGLCPCPCAPLSPAGGASSCPPPVKTPRRGWGMPRRRISPNICAGEHRYYRTKNRGSTGCNSIFRIPLPPLNQARTTRTAATAYCHSPAQRGYLGIRQSSKAGHKFAVPFFLIRLAQLQHCIHGLLVRGIARLQHLHHMLLAGRTHCLGACTGYHGSARPAQVAAGCGPQKQCQNMTCSRTDRKHQR